MARERLTFRQRDVAAAIRAAKTAGLTVSEVKISPLRALADRTEAIARRQPTVMLFAGMFLTRWIRRSMTSSVGCGPILTTSDRRCAV